MNPNTNLPEDATYDLRMEREAYPDPHAATMCHTYPAPGQYTVNYENYPKLIHQCYRHRCSADYCVKKGKCRFKFPQDILSTSTLYLKETLTKITSRFASARNYRWVNCHPPPATAAWGGMIDLQIIIDRESLIHYVAKYGTKVETSSKGFMEIMKVVLRRGIEMESTSKTLIRSLFIKSIGGRAKCKQEATHLALSTSIVVCSHRYVDIRLNGMTRVVVRNDRPEDEDVEEGINNQVGTVTSYNILDAYALRLNRSNWVTNRCTDELFESLPTMS
jgi:hypothetical protein